jgi:triphosphatase
VLLPRCSIAAIDIDAVTTERSVRGRRYKTGAIKLPPDTTVQDGFAAIVHQELNNLIENRNAMVNGGGMECVHRMRVVLRRMNATLVLFKDVVASRGTGEIRKSMKWLSDRLGTARNWDVFESRTLPRLNPHPTQSAAAERIGEAVRSRRRTADRGAIRALRSIRYRSFIRITRHWLAHARWCEDLDPTLRLLLDEPLMEIGKKWLSRSARNARKAGRGMADLKAKQRHRLRIAVKRLRYETDSLSGLYPRRKVKPYVDALRILQDLLGQLNDLAVARQLLRLLKHRDRAAMDGRLRKAKVKLLNRLPPAWEAFRATTPFWR